MTVEAELKRIADALETLVGLQAPTAAPVVEAPKAARKSKSDPIKPDVEAAAAAPEKIGTPAAVQPVYTRDQVYQKLREHADVYSADETKKLMVKYGAKTPKVDEIPASNYPDLMGEVEEAMKKAPKGIV